MKLIDISRISVLSLHYNNYTLDYFLDCQAKLGIKNVELLSAHQGLWMDEYGYQDPAPIRRKLEERGLCCPVFTPENCAYGYQFAAKEPEAIDRTFRYFANGIRFGAELGAKILEANSGWGYWNEPEEEGFKRSAEMHSRLAEVEPALAEVAHKLTGGLQLPNDETGDCQLFTQNLARMAEQAGVKFRFNTPVDQLLCDGEQIYGVKCGDEVIKADAYVMAFGSYSTAMLKGIVDIPVYPLKGYSLTIPIAQEDGAPVSTILDETYKIAITRFDNRIRVGGMAEIVGFNTELLQPRRETLEMVVRDLYPRGGHVEQATFWTGLRPMTPDGTPVVGRTRFKNLWLNTGHGTLGWTMACGSGQLLSDLLSGRTPAIPYEDLSVARYSRGFTPSRPGHLHGAHS